MTATARHILVVDDEARIREVVQYALEQAGFRVELAGDGETALLRVAVAAPDLIVLDIGLPDTDGLEVCRRLRAQHRTPILFLSARGEEIDRVLGLELGGDDYLTKPFSPRELVARVRAILRRAEDSPTPAPDTQLACGPTRVDLERREARYGDARVLLTPTEFGVLVALLRRPGVVLSRGQLMQQAYPYDNQVTERTVDTHVRRIRAKFRAHGGAPIATVHGIGYKADESDGQDGA